MPEHLINWMSEYTMSKHIWDEYNCKLQTWISDGWLILYPEKKLGPPTSLIPLMALVQENKGKVWPIMDYREVNNHIEAYTAHANVCSQRLRDWRRKGSHVSVLDLRKNYLQVHIHCSCSRLCLLKSKGTT